MNIDEITGVKVAGNPDRSAVIIKATELLQLRAATATTATS